MTGDAWITLFTIVAMVVVMARSVLSPAAAVVSATAFVYIVGVVDTEQALVGLSNPAPVAVAGLYVVAGAVSRAGILGPAVTGLLGSGARPGTALARLAVPSAGASAFLANTPIVAMLVPAVVRWSDERQVSASRYLLPLSYATILGGSLTVIGTSTNLVASGLAEESGLGDFDLFDPARISLPIVIVGLVFIVLAAPVVMPPRREPARSTAPTDRSFTVTMQVTADGSLDGRTVERAGLRNLDGVYLVEIRRGDTRVAPVAPDRRLSAHDLLVFAGDVERVVDLHGRPGLAAVSASEEVGPSGVFHEVVVGPSSPLVGRNLRDAGFRARHQAAVVAIHRRGERVTAKLGDVVIRPGDTLLLMAGPDFSSTSKAAGDDFLVVTRLGRVSGNGDRPWNVPIVLVAVALVVVLPATGATNILRAVAAAVGVLIVTRVLRPRHVWEHIDLNVVAMIAAAFGLGQAVQVSGLGDDIADGILDTFGSTGDLGAVLGVLLAAMVLTELITNAAAVALIFPTALSVAAGIDLDPEVLAIGVAVASSASFLTPIGYQTNTMVWGPGRYRLSDYLRLGIPLWALAWLGTGAMVLAVG